MDQHRQGSFRLLQGAGQACDPLLEPVRPRSIHALRGLLDPPTRDLRYYTSPVHSRLPAHLHGLSDLLWLSCTHVQRLLRHRYFTPILQTNPQLSLVLEDEGDQPGSLQGGSFRLSYRSPSCGKPRTVHGARRHGMALVPPPHASSCSLMSLR